jgi:D-alanine-D-alanine ligase
MGISGASVVWNEAGLQDQLTKQLTDYRQPILVERFIRGREVTIGVVGNLMGPVAKRVPEDDHAERVFQGLHFLPPLEVNFAAYPTSEGGIYTNRMKTEWANDFRYLCPAPLEAPLLQQLNWLTAAVFRVTGCLDVGRVDFRLDADSGDRPHILEVNPLPGLYPGLSDLVLEADSADISYNSLINAILDAACARYGLPQAPWR